MCEQEVGVTTIAPENIGLDYYRSLSTSARTSASILLLDTPGADNPMCAGQQSGAPLSKLLSNYLQVS